MQKLLLMGCLVLWLGAGCATAPRREATPAYKPEALRQIFQEQLAESYPVRHFGYTVKHIRFSDDLKRALVVFTNQDPAMRDWEFVLTMDPFRRYHGSQIQPFYTPGTANTPSVFVTVILPEN